MNFAVCCPNNGTHLGKTIDKTLNVNIMLQTRCCQYD